MSCITYIILEEKMEKKPKMYQNSVKKEFHNNKYIYMSYDKNNNNQEVIKNSNDIRKKINDIINASSFIYSKNVHLVIGNDTITRKIIGIFGNNVVTIDNEYIPIDNIEDIYI